MYNVLQFYPNLGIKVRVTEHKTKEDAYETINICRNYAEVPYIAVDKAGRIFDHALFDMTGEEMANIIKEYL